MIILENKKSKEITHKLSFYTFGYDSIYLSYSRSDYNLRLYCKLQSGISDDFHNMLLAVSKRKKSTIILFPACFTEEIHKESILCYQNIFTKFQIEHLEPFMIKLKLKFNTFNLSDFYKSFEEFNTMRKNKLSYCSATLNIITLSKRNIINLVNI